MKLKLSTLALLSTLNYSVANQTTLPAINIEPMAMLGLNSNTNFSSWASAGVSINYNLSTNHSIGIEGQAFDEPKMFGDGFISSTTTNPTEGSKNIFLKYMNHFKSGPYYKMSWQVGLGWGQIISRGKQLSNETEKTDPDCDDTFAIIACHTETTIQYERKVNGPLAINLAFHTKAFFPKFQYIGIGNETGITLIGTNPQFYTFLTLPIGIQ